MIKNRWIGLLLTFIFMTTGYAGNKAILLNIDGAISPAIQDYVERGIERATPEEVAVIILQLNTPGGLETSMRGINAAILKSPVPVITYVAPSGARAASAGIFIMYASHLTAMAPGTNAGAASPVNLGGNGEKSDNKKPDTSMKKAMNDAAAYIRSLAQLRDRNVAWGEKAVTEAASVSATEAEKLNIINFVAKDYADLLQQANGKTVVVNGVKQTINTDNLTIHTIEKDWRADFLAFITNPNIAYLLMLLAIYGLFFELSNPGLILPGVAGVIALVLVLYAFQLMPINYAGLTLMLVGIGFMIMEVYITSYGALGIGGVIAFVLGSIMLFDSNSTYYHLNWSLVIGMALVSLAFFFVAITIVIRAHKRAIVSGKEALIGTTGTVISLMNDHVTVSVLGEIWDARSNASLNEGDNIKVTAINGLTLNVEPVSQQDSSKEK